MGTEGKLVSSLRAAIRFIEVQHAYRGAMTAAEVEAAIKERTPNVVEIGANSVTTLASFDFDQARAALAEAGDVIQALRWSEAEFATLIPRLMEPYRKNAVACRDACAKALRIMEGK